MSRPAAEGGARELPQEERISRWEWVAGAFGLAVVVAALAVLIREASVPATPPALAVRVDSVQLVRQTSVVHFTVANRGTAPAMEVGIEGALVDGGDTLVSRATLRYIPGGSRRSGGLLFPVAPRVRALRLRVLGYEEP